MSPIAVLSDPDRGIHRERVTLETDRYVILAENR